MSNRRAGAAETSRGGHPWSLPRERMAQRQAIIEVAFRLANEKGFEALTLGAVAEAAGIARAALYGHFGSKRELLSLLQGAPQAAVEKAEARAEADEKPEISPIKDKPVRAESAKRDAIPPDPLQPRTAQKANDYDSNMRKQAQTLGELSKRIIIPKSMMTGGTDSAIARLEMRIGVIEQSFAATEKRIAGNAEELIKRINSVAEASQKLREHFDGYENCHQYALAEMRLDIHNLANVAKPVPVTKQRDMPSEHPASHIAAQELSGNDHATQDKKPADDRAESTPPTEPRQLAYLSLARHAAAVAAEVEAATLANATAKRWHVRHWLLGAAVFAAALVLVAIYAHSGVTAGASASPKPMQHPPSPSETSRAELIHGLVLLEGIGQRIDLNGGVRWIERAAKDGQPVAAEYLGTLYAAGTGVDADMAQAVYWFQEAAQRGNVAAMANLAKAYAGGWPGNTNYPRAARWFYAAARFGDKDSQFDLAILYERGLGAERSAGDAYAWYSIAAAQGDREAAMRMSALAAELPPEVLREAQRFAAVFRPSASNPATNQVPGMLVSHAVAANAPEPYR